MSSYSYLGKCPVCGGIAEVTTDNLQADTKAFHRIVCEECGLLEREWFNIVDDILVSCRLDRSMPSADWTY
jgi:uncharacterized Zn finger protein